MSKKRVLGAAFGALAFSLVFVSGALAQAPTYTISLDKTADPTTLPAAGGDVTYTVTVTNTGTGDFQVLSVSDDTCTLSGDGSEFEPSNKFEAGDSVSYTCTETVTETTTNTATANACQNSGNPCNNDSHDATATDSATVTVGTDTATIDDVAKGAGAAMLALILLAIGGLGFLGTTNRLPKLPKFR